MLQRLSVGFLAFLLLTGCSGPKVPPENQTKAPTTVETPGSSITTPPVAPVRVFDKRNLLLDPNRIDLAICIQVVGETEVDPAVVQKIVRSALKGLASRASWERLGYDLLQNRVDVGCPSGPYLLKPGVKRVQGGLASDPTPFVEKSSPFLVFLFVLPKADVDRIFADVFDRTSFQEFLRGGDSLMPVSTGLYLTPSDIDQERVEWGLSEALHL